MYVAANLGYVCLILRPGQDQMISHLTCLVWQYVGAIDLSLTFQIEHNFFLLKDRKMSVYSFLQETFGV